MNSKSTRDIFQYVLLGLFAFLAAFSVWYISSYESDKDKVFVDTSPVIIWGPSFGVTDAIGDALKKMTGVNPSLQSVQYVKKNPLTVYGDLVEAIAEGNPPDLLLVEASSLLELKSQLLPISYEMLSMRKFRDTYVEGAEVFALPEGIYALPVMVDPLVLYWNRDLFTNALVTQVPADWDTFVKVVPRLSIIEQGADLKQAAIAFGEYDNVMHAREIVSALMLQTGTPIVINENNKYRCVLGEGSESVNPALAIEFYTDFSNPRKTVYSWNKTFKRSRESFATNKVAMYGGFASEAVTLTTINPNLNFDVAMWPQSARAKTKVTYGKFYGLAVVKNSLNVRHAMEALNVLSGSEATIVWSKYANVPSTLRSVLGEVPTDPFAEVLARSAIIARTWHSPHGGGQVDDIFAQMVNDVTSGRELPESTLPRAAKDIDILLEKYNKVQ